MMMLKRSLPLLAALMVAGACARSYPPPGGDPDKLAPALVSTYPEPLAVVTRFTGPVVFRFDERLRTRSFNRTLIAVMPARPEDVEAEVHGNEVRIQLKGGWHPDQIYQVLVRPGVEDLFSNRRRQQAELIFSTGPQIPPTALAGLIEDRVTGRPAAEAVLEAVRRTDSTVYRAYGDSTAFFAVRHLPYGTYDLKAYADRNRNSRLDPGEDRAPGTLASLAQGQDTVQLFLQLLPYDTVAPRLLRAELADSLRVRLTFDDFLPPDSAFMAASATFFQLPDSTLLPMSLSLTVGGELERPALEKNDSTPEPERQPVAAVRPRRALPDKSALVSLTTPLRPGEYAIVMRGVRNVNGLTGGGSARLQVKAVTREPARADTTARDTLPPPRLDRTRPWPMRSR